MNLQQILFEKMGLDGRSLHQERAVVTGGAMGIGRQAALALAHLGARVAIVDREEAEAEDTARRIRDAGGEVLVIITDIAAEGRLAAALDAVRGRWGGIDILVNNAAAAFIGSYEEETQEVWDRVFDTNLRRPAAAIKSVLPEMIERRRGVIANVISLEGLAFSSAYSATKVGMRSMTRSLAAEIGNDSGVWLFSFAPGIVDTPLVNNYFYTELANRFGLTMEDIIAGIGGNPGYPGLMPAEHCAAALAGYVASAQLYHGQVVNPFLPLAKAGVIRLEEGLQIGPMGDVEATEDRLPEAIGSLREYLKSVTELNRDLEYRVEVRTRELTEANKQLQAALHEVKQLSGLLPICSYCKKIRDDQGYWNQLEGYLQKHSKAQFSHGICNECMELHHPEMARDH